jgi:hypothetical protein
MIFNETYLMVMSEKKSIETHENLQQLEDHFEVNLLLNGGLLLDSKEIKIGNCKAFQNEANWTVDGEPLVYLVTFIETHDTIFKIYCWTLISQKEYIEDFRKVANSFSIVQSNHAQR